MSAVLSDKPYTNREICQYFLKKLCKKQNLWQAGEISSVLCKIKEEKEKSSSGIL